jgi:hypothetical protein
MNSTQTPAYEIEDGELTPPPVSLSLPFYPEDNVLLFDEVKQHQIETVNLDAEPTTSKLATLIQNFLAYIFQSERSNAIFTILTKFANNEIQFTFQDGSAVINLQYFQEMSAYATQNFLSSAALEKAFVFDDDLEKIFSSGRIFSINFTNKFIGLNNQMKLLVEHNSTEAICNLRASVKNISMHIRRAVEKQFPSSSAPNLFQPTSKASQAKSQHSEVNTGPATEPSLTAASMLAQTQTVITEEKQSTRSFSCGSSQ